MIRARLNPAARNRLPNRCVGVLLPLPLAGAYDYKLPAGVTLPRGALVAAPLGNREVLGVVWGAAEGTVGDNRLKVAEPLEGAPALPGKLCDFIDWVARLHPEPAGRDPGHGAALARRLRAGSAAHRLCAGQRDAAAHVGGAQARAGGGRTTVWRAACRPWRKTPMSRRAVVRGLIAGRRAGADRAAGIRALRRARCRISPRRL